MTRITKTLTILAIALFAGGVTTSAASTRPPIVPKAGHYSGYDGHGKHIGFTYYPGRGMNSFTVDYRISVGGGHVTPSNEWALTCHHTGYCSLGGWNNATTVSGLWKSKHADHATNWSAHWVRSTNGSVTH